jgi:mono/diheme cytochrome c family protein
MTVSLALDRRVWASLCLLGGMVAGACGASAKGATDASLATARSRAAPGADVYTKECAGCHGAHGEGLGNAPAIMGAGALPEFPRDQSATGNPSTTDPQELQIRQLTRPAGAPTRDPFRTAQDVYAYVSGRMPKGKRAGQLKPDEYWAVVNYMLLAHGTTAPDSGINEGNAASVSVQAR